MYTYATSAATVLPSRPAASVMARGGTQLKGSDTSEGTSASDAKRKEDSRHYWRESITFLRKQSHADG